MDHEPEPLAAIRTTLEQIAATLARLAPPVAPWLPDSHPASAWIWDGDRHQVQTIDTVSRVPLHLLQGIDRTRDTLLANTERFVAGFPANNALLWGARGMGKSSLVKAVHAEVVRTLGEHRPTLVEIHREDIGSLPILLQALRQSSRRFILFCDDLSFDSDDTSYKSLKTVLEGGIEGRPDNTVFYATSNRRHMMPRSMMENERSTAIHPSETVEEKVSMSDRFGLWLGFHACSQDHYLAMIRAYALHYGIVDADGLPDIEPEALEWSVTRGARSGRVAWQFIQALAGERGVPLSPVEPDPGNNGSPEGRPGGLRERGGECTQPEPRG